MEIGVKSVPNIMSYKREYMFTILTFQARRFPDTEKNVLQLTGENQEQMETFHQLEMFSACPSYQVALLSGENQEQNKGDVDKLPFWDRPENVRDTLYKQYAYINRQVSGRTRAAMIRRWKLSRILSAEEMESLSYQRPSKIPEEKDYYYWLRQAVMDLFKTLAYDLNDPTVLGQAISSYIQLHPNKAMDIESRKLAAKLKSRFPDTEQLRKRRQKVVESLSKTWKSNPAMPEDGHWNFFDRNIPCHQGTSGQKLKQLTAPVGTKKINLSKDESLPAGGKVHTTSEESFAIPVEIETFLRAYIAGQYDKQKVIWTQQRSPEME